MQDPIQATEDAIHEEVLSVMHVAERLCAVTAVLESVVITRSGTVLALWQPTQGSSDPATLRAMLRQALPHASKKQVVTDTVLLHTTVARITSTESSFSDKGSGSGDSAKSESQSSSLWAASEAITREFCGTTTIMDALWYVEEQDLLALALQGRMKKKTIPLKQC